jgi:endoglucanase
MLLWSSFVSALSMAVAERDALNLPFTTKGRDIFGSNGDIFHYKGTNWPGHQEIMIPEGLQHASIADIVSWIPEFGLNSVRITFAIEMIDDIYSNNTNQTLERSVINALGQDNGTLVLEQILEHNPQFTNKTTRLEVWDAVAQELADQGVILHLDNHVSKAFWCCGDDDGNGWFGEKYFNVDDWIRGWSFISNHVRFYSIILSMGLTCGRQRRTGRHLHLWVSEMNSARQRLQSLSTGTHGMFT